MSQPFSPFPTHIDFVVGFILREFRTDLGLNQSDVGKAVELPTSSISKIETGGTHRITFSEVYSILKVYDKTVIDLSTRYEELRELLDEAGVKVYTSINKIPTDKVLLSKIHMKHLIENTKI